MQDGNCIARGSCVCSFRPTRICSITFSIRSQIQICSPACRRRQACETKSHLRNTGPVDVTVNVAATMANGERMTAPATIRAKSFGEIAFKTANKIARVEIDSEKLYPPDGLFGRRCTARIYGQRSASSGKTRIRQAGVCEC